MKNKRNKYIIQGVAFSREEIEDAELRGVTFEKIKSRMQWRNDKRAALDDKGKTVSDVFNRTAKQQARFDSIKKVPKDELIDEIGRIKYMQSQNLLNPPVLTKRMIQRAKEYKIDISKVKPIEVDISGLSKMLVREDDSKENRDTANP